MIDKLDQIRNTRTIIVKLRWSDGPGHAMESHIDLEMIPGDRYVFTLDWRGGEARGRLKNLGEGFLVKDYGVIFPAKPVSYAIGGTSEEWYPVLGDRDGMGLEIGIRKGEEE